MCNYYRKFINKFSRIAQPLYETTKKDGFVWNEEQETAFESLKAKMTSGPVLQLFNPNVNCELRVDACRNGIGAILLQEGEDKQPHPVAYASRTLTKAEKNYSITELEALTVIWCLGYMRHMIYGRPLKIVTGHHALCWLKTLRDPTGRLARWAIKLSEYEHEIVHKSGVKHRDADCLSRYPVKEGMEADEDASNEIYTYILDPNRLGRIPAPRHVRLQHRKTGNNPDVPIHAGVR